MLKQTLKKCAAGSPSEIPDLFERKPFGKRGIARKRPVAAFKDPQHVLRRHGVQDRAPPPMRISVPAMIRTIL